MSSELIDIEQVGARYGISKSSVYRWLRDGLLPKPVTPPGSAPLWTPEALAEFEKSQRLEAMQEQEAIERLEELRIPNDGSDLPNRRLLRTTLNLNPNCPEHEVIEEVLTLKEQRDAMRKERDAANRKLRTWAGILRRIEKLIAGLREPPTALDTINTAVRNKEIAALQARVKAAEAESGA